MSGAEDPNGAWLEARWLEREWRAVEEMRERGLLDEAMAEARWDAALTAVRPEALLLAARFMVWCEEQRLERGG